MSRINNDQFYKKMRNRLYANPNSLPAVQNQIRTQMTQQGAPPQNIQKAEFIAATLAATNDSHPRALGDKPSYLENHDPPDQLSKNYEEIYIDTLQLIANAPDQATRNEINNLQRSQESLKRAPAYRYPVQNPIVKDNKIRKLYGKDQPGKAKQ